MSQFICPPGAIKWGMVGSGNWHRGGGGGGRGRAGNLPWCSLEDSKTNIQLLLNDLRTPAESSWIRNGVL